MSATNENHYNKIHVIVLQLVDDYENHRMSRSQFIGELIELSMREREQAVKEALAGQWMPIETAPKDGTRIFLWKGSWLSAPVGWWGDDGDWDGCLGWCLADEFLSYGQCAEAFIGYKEDIDDGCMPTHWMPLPTPPKESK